MVLDSFIKRSVTGGLGSAQAEVMAETSVSLSAANVALVARKVWLECFVENYKIFVKYAIIKKIVILFFEYPVKSIFTNIFIETIQK